jgi:tryptophan synthase beta chain
VAIQQLECYAAAVTFARTEGIIPAPESSHAIAAAIREAEQAREEGKEKVILFNLSGHGLMDLNGYADFLDGKLEDHSLSELDLQASLACLEGLPRPELVGV